VSQPGRRFMEGNTPLLRLRTLVVVGLIGLIAAVGFALGPVQQAEFVYSFRPAQSAVVDGELPNPAVASLALARSVPDQLQVTLPCEPARSASSFNSMWLGVWRTGDGETRSPLLFPDLGDPVLIVVSNEVVSVVLGSDEILRVPIESVVGCVADIRYQDGVWMVAVGDESASAVGDGPRFAEATFAGPGASSDLSSVTVRSRELGTSPSLMQLLLASVAALSLVVVGREIWIRGRRVDRTEPELPRSERLWQLVNAPNVVVLLILVTWTVLIPLNIDDGWIAARVRAYPSHGDIAGLFTAESAPMPFGYWLEWLQHLWLGLGDSALMLRIPSLGLGMGIWLGLRSVGRSLGITKTGGALWVMAAAFLVGFGAWGITLRAEPVIAALSVASLGLALRFQRGERGSVVVWWLAVIALAVSAHPAGIIVAAPALVSWRSLWAWGREGRDSGRVATASLLGLATLLTLLVFVDSNVATKLASIDAYQSDAHSLSILDEPIRYGLLNDTPYSTPMRRGSVALIFLGLGLHLINRRPRDRVASVPAWSIVVGLALLTLTPSKWPWHFGGMLGLAALVVALELRNLSRVRSAVAVFGIGVLSFWAWSSSLGWAVFDLRAHSWGGDAGVWTALLAVIGGVSFALRRWRGDQWWTPPEFVAVGMMGLVIVVTASTLASDSIRTDGWTFGGQNAATLLGAAGCGLGDELQVPDPGSLHTLTASPETESSAADQAAARSGFSGQGSFSQVGFPDTGVNRTSPVIGMGRYGSYLGLPDAPPDAVVGSLRSDWFNISSAEEVVAVMVMGSYSGPDSANAVGVQWGVVSGGDVVELGIQLADVEGHFLDWQMVMLSPPAGADRVRMLLRDETAGSGDAWVAASDPLGLSVSSLSDVLARDGDPTVLISPAISPYFPCATVPPLADAVVPVPGLIIETWGTVWQTTFAAAVVSDRYFRLDITLDPPLRSAAIGAHSGDATNFVFVSQGYLTGRSARVTGRFDQVSG
jgi:hypothetical protein